MSALRSLFRSAPAIPKITSENSALTANPKLATILLNELKKKGTQPYYKDLQNYIHYLNQAYAIMRISPLNRVELNRYLELAAETTGGIQPHDNELANSLYTYTTILRYLGRVESRLQREELEEFRRQFPAIPNAPSNSLQGLLIRYAELKKGGATRRNKKTTRRNRRKTRYAKRVAH